MKFTETHYDNSKTGCCAELDLDHWDRQEITWRDKPFLKDHVRAFLHVPLNYGQVMARDRYAVDQAEAWPDELLVITDEVSPWRSDVYTAVDRDVPDAETCALSGRFLSRVFEGPYRDAGKWTEEMKAWVEAKGEEADRIFFYYATCPKCSKKLGKNQVVLLACVGEAVDDGPGSEPGEERGALLEN
jgi:hypothetical protein